MIWVTMWLRETLKSFWIHITEIRRYQSAFPLEQLFQSKEGSLGPTAVTHQIDWAHLLDKGFHTSRKQEFSPRLLPKDCPNFKFHPYNFRKHIFWFAKLSQVSCLLCEAPLAPTPPDEPFAQVWDQKQGDENHPYAFEHSCISCQEKKCLGWVAGWGNEFQSKDLYMSSPVTMTAMLFHMGLHACS